MVKSGRPPTEQGAAREGFVSGKHLYLFLFLFLVLPATACGGGSVATAPVALPGQSAADAQATLNAYNLQLQATADVQAQQTAAAAQATAAHDDMLRATAGAATAAAATATAGPQQTTSAQVARQTDVAINLTVDSATADASATHAAATPTIEAQETADTQNAINVAIVQEDTKLRMEQERRREEMRLLWQPRLYTLGMAALASIGLAGLAFVAFLIWRAVYIQRHPVHNAPNGVSVLQQSQGLIAAPKLLAITGPQARPQPAPAPAAGMPDEEPIPLPRFRHGHVLVAGETGSGKSNALLALLAVRPRVVVLDPHSAGGDWGAAQVIGAGRNFEAIRAYMDDMGQMLRARYAQRAEGVMDFEPLTVAVDEMPAIVEAIGREIATVWREWLREGRKVGLFLALSTQSMRVRTLGIEGERDLLENFNCVLVLGDLARQQYGVLVERMEYPAVLRARGQARPVVIPHMAATAEQAIELPGATSREPIFVASPPVFMQREPDPGNLSAADQQRIAAAYRRHNGNLAAVQREIFPSYGNSGGRAFYAIKDTLAEMGLITLPYRGNGNGSSGSSGLHVVGVNG